MTDPRSLPRDWSHPQAIQRRFFSALAPVRPILLLSFYSVLVAGCYDHDDDRMYPYVFEREFMFPGMAGIADLDFDGSDEIIHRVPFGDGDINERWLFSESDGSVIQQVNVPGKVIRAPSFADIDGDGGDLEVLFGVSRNDSLFMYAFNSDATSAGDPVLITAGKKRIDPNGTTYDWEAEATFFMIDVDGDQEKELVSIVASTYAGLPRGVFVHNPSTGEELGSVIFGAPVQVPVIVRDIDRDGKTEMVFASGLSGHGVDEGGLNDGEGYLVVVELSNDPVLEWSMPVAIPNTSFLAFQGQFDSERKRELVLMTIQNRSTRGQSSELWRFNLDRPLSDQPPHVVNIPGILRNGTAGDLDGDGLQELYTLSDQGEITRYESLKNVHSASFPGGTHLAILPDFTGDDLPEILLTVTGGESYILNRDFGIVARSTFQVNITTFKTKIGERRILSSDYVALSVVRNPLYLLNRYGDEGGIGLVLMILVVGFVVALKRVKSSSQTEIFQLDFGSFLEPVFRIDERNRAIPLNPSAAKFGNPFERLPDLTIGNAKGVCLPDKPATISARLKGEGPVSCIVFPVGSSGHLLFLLQSESASSVEGWRQLTSRVAYDIRNPLTSILLSVQRIQADSRSFSPDARATIQPMLTRIEDRIDHLRQKSHQIMKMVGAEEETLTHVQPEVILQSTIQAVIESMPDDIEIIKKLQPDLPSIRFDSDLMESVLESVMMNGIQAMPDGGRLTIRSEYLKDFRIDEKKGAHSFVCISITDSGIGIEPRDLDHIFDPGFSTREEQSGLGLTFGKRILEQNGGHIEVDSVVGSGTEFVLFFRANQE